MSEQDGVVGAKRTMTLNFTEAEMEVLVALIEKKDLSKTALLRLYFQLDVRVQNT